jgi:hypothetical protein
MVAVTFIISYDDVIGTANSYPHGGITIKASAANTSSFSNPVTVLRNCNLNSGTYRARVEGVQIASGSINTTSFAYAPQLINISSPAFAFPGNAVPGLSFTNSSMYTHADVGGNREFLINVGQGNIGIDMSIAQFGTGNAGAIVGPYALDKTATWAKAEFAFIVLSLSLKNVNEQAVFGSAK